MKTYFPGDPGYEDAYERIDMEYFVFLYALMEMQCALCVEICAGDTWLVTTDSPKQVVIVSFERILGLLLKHCFIRPYSISIYEGAEDYVTTRATAKNDYKKLAKIYFVRNVASVTEAWCRNNKLECRRFDMWNALKKIKPANLDLFAEFGKRENMDQIYALVQQELTDKAQEKDKSV